MSSEIRKTYTVREVAGLLGVNHKGIYDAVAENHIPHVKIGRRILIPRVAFDRWLENSHDQTAAG